jgi:hypothetical protein
MLALLMYIRTVWNDYFTGTTTPQQPKLYTSTQTLSGTNVYFLDCLFRSCTSSSHGGAFYCDSVTYLLVESSSFFSCKTSNSHGGAIFFSNSNGQCVLHEVCGYDCSSTRSGTSYSQFAYIYVNDGLSSKNYVNYSSIVRCVNGRSDSYYTLRLSCGKIYCPSVNISMNKCGYYTGIICRSYGDSNSVTCSLTYSSFSDNIANGNKCIRLDRSGSKYEIKSCNILRNKEITGSYGIVYADGNLKIEDSCILENTATYIFYANSYTITLSNCTVDSTSKYGNVVTQNTVTKSFIHALNHMSTQNCHSKYDSAGTLIPIIQTPSPSKKQIRYFTYSGQFCRPQLRDFISFAIIFIFNFIHPYASIDLSSLCT